MGQLQGIKEQIAELGYQLLFVSPDRPKKIRELTSKKSVDYTLLSDSDMRVATAMGIAYTVDDKMNARLKKYGIDIEDASGREHHLLPVPAVFILNKDQVVEFQYADPDYKVRIDPDLLLAAARAAR